MKKYKVIKNLPKSLVNANRFKILKPGKTVKLTYDSKVEFLIKQGFLTEVVEFKKRKIKRPKPKVQEDKFYSKKKNKTKAKRTDEALEDKME